METAQAGTGNGKLAMLSVRVVYWDLQEKKIKRCTFSVISEDSKEDSFHAWAHFRAILLQV